MTSTVFHLTSDECWLPLAVYPNELDAQKAIDNYWSKQFPYAQLAVDPPTPTPD